MKRLVASLLLVAAIPSAGVLITGPAAGAPSQEGSIVRNGNFERPVLPPNGQIYFAGQAFGHWRVTRGSVDLHAKYFVCARGRQCVDLSGGGPGTIAQRPSALVGQSYTLGFALAGNPDGQPTVKEMLVKWQGTIIADLTFDTTGHSGQDMGWTYYSFDVTATVANPTLKFVSLTHGPYGPVVDDVSLVPVVR